MLCADWGFTRYTTNDYQQWGKTFSDEGIKTKRAYPSNKICNIRLYLLVSSLPNVHAVINGH